MTGGTTFICGYTWNYPTNLIDNTTYTATFNGNGGSNGTSITKKKGEQLGTLPSRSKACYTFNGWYDSSGKQISSTTPMPGNVTYTAHWTKKDGWSGDKYCSGGSYLQNGWYKLGSSWYFFLNGTRQKNQYRKYSDGYYYWLDASSGASGSVAWNKVISGTQCWVHKKTDTSQYMANVGYYFGDNCQCGTLYREFNSAGWNSACTGW